jgi:poly-gamma-glutamate synthesis protein (capsule biosynthesis protein)
MPKRTAPATRTAIRPDTGARPTTTAKGASGIPLVLSFAGDCTFGTVNGDDGPNRFPAVYRRSGRKDYPFALIKPWFANDDLTAVNFECTLTDASRTADKQWKFKGDARYAEIFPAGSVEAVGLSNNHSFDYLQAGFNDTVVNFTRAHVPVFYQNVPYVTTLRGVETVLIGGCTVVGENTTLIDGTPEQVLNEIKRYKKPGNIVIVVMHWGSELDTVPRLWQQDLGRRFIDAGADAVVGAHPHVVQGIERYKGKYIAYSLGNFAFGGNSLARHPETFVLRLRFRSQHGTTSVDGASIIPCLITSTQEKRAGVLINNYQPKPVFGDTAARIVSLVLARSAGLQYGVKRLAVSRLPQRR